MEELDELGPKVRRGKFGSRAARLYQLSSQRIPVIKLWHRRWLEKGGRCGTILPMVTAEEIMQLPRAEKLRVMGLIWEELSSNPSEIPSPAWHGEALAETERRVASGEEVSMDWSEAKDLLRRERP